MTSIIYVGMDVHTTNYTLCCYSFENDQIFATAQMEPDYRNILKYLERIRKNYDDVHFLCGYEAGCLGYSLYNNLTDNNVECVILAPSTMPEARKKKKIKTDKRDAANIARCLAYNTYSAVNVPTATDNAVKEYIRMRDDANGTLKRYKQQLLSFCTRHGKCFTEGRSYWTQKHMAWLGKLYFGHPVLQETFQEYLILYNQALDKVKMFDKRIEELAQREEYAENVKKLSCFIGVKAHTALGILAEIGDFGRFAKAENFASFLGLVPGEDSSGDSIQRMGITKAGNSHVRRLFVEAAQSYSRGTVGKKSKALTARQAGNEPKVIAYADRANERLKRKFYRIMFKSKRNIAVVAVARELACFVWGMMTDNVA
jgi:transposase